MAKQVESVIIRNRTYAVNDTKTAKADRTSKSAAADKPLLKAKPSWWNYFWYLFFSWLIVPLLIALWKRAGTVFYVYPDRVVLERGVMSKHISQVLISDIRSIDTKYSFIERMFRVGDIWIGTAGMSGYEIVAEGMPNPARVADLILRRRRAISGTTD